MFILVYLFYSQIFVYLIMLSIFICRSIFLQNLKQIILLISRPPLFVYNKILLSIFFVFNLIFHQLYVYIYYLTFFFF